MAWELKHTWDFAVDGATASPINFIGLAGAEDILIIYQDVTRSVASSMSARVSVNNGASFFSAGSDHVFIDNSGVILGTTRINLTLSSVLTAQSGHCLINATRVSAHKVDTLTRTNAANQFRASNSPIDAVQVGTSAAANFNGGKIFVLIRTAGEVQLGADIADDTGLAAALSVISLLAAALVDDAGLDATLFVGSGGPVLLSADMSDDEGLRADLARQPVIHIQSVMVVV